MRYIKPIAAVVLGAIASYTGFALSPKWTYLEASDFIVASATFGVLIVCGLCVAIYGLFTGIEVAVAEGIDTS